MEKEYHIGEKNYYIEILDGIGDSEDKPINETVTAMLNGCVFKSPASKRLEKLRGLRPAIGQMLSTRAIRSASMTQTSWLNSSRTKRIIKIQAAKPIARPRMLMAEKSLFFRIFLTARTK